MRRWLLLGLRLLLATTCGLSGAVFHELVGLPPGLAYADNPDAITLQGDGSSATMATARRNSTATLLQNGKVLVVGGNNGPALASAELYDPVTNIWSNAANMVSPRTHHSATLLQNGKVLVAGGFASVYLPGSSGRPVYSSPELYDPRTNTWSSAGQAAGRFQHAATLLNNGKVLVAGGFDGFNALASAELYDPSTN